MLLSVCLIIKNEEDNLDRCLSSVVNIADEIIIVDTGSTDNSVKIAKQYTDNIYQFEWIDDFSAARNYSLSFAKSKFILILDADEVVENATLLKSTLNSLEDSYGGWLINLDSFNIKNGETHKYTTQLLRLIRNNEYFKFSGIIHEQIINSIIESGYKIGSTNINVIHYGYGLNEEKMTQKQQRNLNLLSKHIALNPYDGYNLFNLAKTYFALKDNANAKKYFKLALENNSKEGVVYPSCLNYFSVLLFQEKNFNETISLASESLNINKNQAFANYVLGDTYFELGQHEKSYFHYKELLLSVLNPSNFSKVIGDYHPPLSQIYFRIGRSEILLDKLENAKISFQNGLKNNENDKMCLLGLIEVLKKLGDTTNEKIFVNLYREKYSDNIMFENIKKKKVNNEEKTLNVSSVKDLKAILNKNKVNQKGKSDDKIPLITLSMIVKNEESMLEDCLVSVQGIVDEIVIVDTGSTDGTKQIAKKYNANIYDFEWCDDFAAARNEALKHSTGKWILYLDADERIDCQNLDIQKLREDLSNAKDDLGGIIITIESKHGIQDESSEIHRGGYPRLFRNLGYPKIYFKGRVHEQITPSLMENKLGMMKSDIRIIHKGYDIPEEQMQKKLKRNYTLLLRHVQEEPLNGYAWYQLGQTLGRMLLIKESKEAIEMAIKCGNLSDSVYASACSTLSQYAGNSKDYINALLWAEKSLEKAPNQIYGLNLKGYALLELNRKTEAKAVFQKALDLWKSTKNSVPQSGFDIMLDEKVILNGLEKSQD